MLSTAKPIDYENRKVYVARIDELKKQHEESGNRCKVEYKTQPQFTSFFVVVFVFGLIMSQWALILGHVAAWVAGLVFCISGISVALHSLFTSLQERDQHLSEQIANRNRLDALPHSQRRPLSKPRRDFRRLDSSNSKASA